MIRSCRFAALAHVLAVEFSDSREHMLAEGRRRFAAFYAEASPCDAAIMDAAVLARVVLVRCVTCPRASLPQTLRVELERVTNANEQFFTDVREAVRTSPTFAQVPVEVQRFIVRHLFTVEANEPQ